MTFPAVRGEPFGLAQDRLVEPFLKWVQDGPGLTGMSDHHHE